VGVNSMDELKHEAHNDSNAMKIGLRVE